ncbi:MAG: AraC family transcriptional regulator [Syntrophomonadaceae bacterium]|nr:AraC family transcriptional regulator [Syntrophomonadaceae bacterium]
MGNLSEKISYLKGLSEGSGMAETAGPQGKIITGILDALGDMAEGLNVLHSEVEDIKLYVESIDDDLSELEDDVYQDTLDDDYVEITCKNCGEEVYFEPEILDDEDVTEIICPRCNEVVFVNDGSFDLEPSPLNDDIQGQKSPGKNDSGTYKEQ